jgi:hemoglobin-like flavoprotein
MTASAAAALGISARQLHRLFEPNPAQASPAIHDLAIRHVEYGVKLADYEALREALLWTLEQALGEDLTPAVREAWMICYDELASEMNAAADI